MALCSFVFGMASPSNGQRKPGSNQRLGTVYIEAYLNPNILFEGVRGVWVGMRQCEIKDINLYQARTKLIVLG